MSKKQEPPVPVIADGMTLGIVGAGVMGQTLIRGLLASGLIPRDRLWAGDKNGVRVRGRERGAGDPRRGGLPGARRHRRT